ncbi:MAG TPA: NADH-quinone oxidoreductase subunit C [Caldimonas sp.]|nr:NADH-quinone oxidoreductase subunit C [Caldimonas sp.]
MSMRAKTLRRLGVDFTALPHAAVPAWHATVDAPRWLDAARHAHAAGSRLVSLWGTDRRAMAGGTLAVSAAYALPEGLAWVDLPMADGTPGYPDIADQHPAAARMQRAAADLVGIRPVGAPDARPWLDHGAWTEHHPLRIDPAARAAPAAHDYAFVRVEGDGVHEIPVGPVHAGIIEPGHFRFSVVGEKVLRLEERLGYVHRGMEQRLARTPPLDAHRLAGRMSGDCTVAYAWSYCMALESATGCTPPPRALHLRALLLERERVANHLGDLGALGNDGAFAFGLAQFSRLREDWLRLSGAVFGHRLTMDAVVPGGVARDLDASAREHMIEQCDAVQAEVRALRAIYDEHAGLQDRFAGTGCVTRELAARLGLAGLAARASGQAGDLRCDQPWAPYDTLAVREAVHNAGDVAARVAVRFDEVDESMRLIRVLCATLPEGAIREDIQLTGAAAFGAGRVEGWRGEVFVALELDAGGRIVRCHAHDPSWHAWHVLEHAVIGNIVPDFPLINKSFNLSYAGHDA